MLTSSDRYPFTLENVPLDIRPMCCYIRCQLYLAVISQSKLDLGFGWRVVPTSIPVLPDAGADVLVDGALEGEGAALRHGPAPVLWRHRRDLEDIAAYCNRRDCSKSSKHRQRGPCCCRHNCRARLPYRWSWTRFQLLLLTDRKPLEDGKSLNHTSNAISLLYRDGE